MTISQGKYIEWDAGGHGWMHRGPAYFHELCAARPVFHNGKFVTTRKVMVRNLFCHTEDVVSE